jgi:hypothetical protein
VTIVVKLQRSDLRETMVQVLLRHYKAGFTERAPAKIALPSREIT